MVGELRDYLELKLQELKSGFVEETDSIMSTDFLSKKQKRCVARSCHDSPDTTHPPSTNSTPAYFHTSTHLSEVGMIFELWVPHLATTTATSVRCGNGCLEGCCPLI